MGIHQLIGAFSKEFGITLFALIPLTFVFLHKLYKEHIQKKETENIKNIELLVQWFNEHGLPKDKFISEQLIHKRFGFLIDYEVIEWILSKENPSSLFYKYRYTSSYIAFDRDSKGFKCKEKWTEKKLKSRQKIFEILSFFSLFGSLGFIVAIVFSFKQSFDLFVLLIFAAYSFAALLLAGSTIDSALGMEGSLELLKHNKKIKSD